VQRPDRHHDVKVLRQLGERFDRLHVDRPHLQAEQASDASHESDVVLDDVHERELRAQLGERQRIEGEAATDVEDPFARDHVAVQQPVPAADVKRSVEVALRAPEFEQLVVW
jgi:hypothetical protein